MLEVAGSADSSTSLARRTALGRAYGMRFSAARASRAGQLTLELADALAGAPQFALEAPDICINLIAVVAAHLLREDWRVVRCWTGSGVSAGHLPSLAGGTRCRAGQNPRLGARAGAHEQQAAARHPSRRRALVSMTAGPGLRAHTGSMGRMIWTILGAILAIWVGFMAIGWIFAMLKTFFVIGLIAVVVFIIVSLVAKLPRRG